MKHFIITVMSKYGYLGVFFLILIENIFPPIPSEVILLFGGFMTNFSNLNLPLMVVASTIGSVVGAIILYYFGYILNKDRLKKIVSSKIGKFLRLKESNINKADDWFSKKGPNTVFFCRFIPIVRSLISIPAGMNKMTLSKFLLYTTIGSAIWNIVLLSLGSILGANWEKSLIFFQKYSSLIRIIIIVLILLLIYNKVVKKRSE